MFCFLLMAMPSAKTTIFSNGPPKIEFISVRTITPVTVENARFQLVLYIFNSGQEKGVINKVYFNSELVKINGIKDGDLLPDTQSIASSILDGGTILPPGETVQIFIWTGRDLNLAGDNVVIHLQSLNDLQLSKSVTIK